MKIDMLLKSYYLIEESGYFIRKIAPWIMLFSNRVNSWLKDRKEKTEIKIKKWTCLKLNTFLLLKYFAFRLFFLTIPKPLKQYTLFKKDYPFRSPKRVLYEPEA